MATWFFPGDLFGKQLGPCFLSLGRYPSLGLLSTENCKEPHHWGSPKTQPQRLRDSCRRLNAASEVLNAAARGSALAGTPTATATAPAQNEEPEPRVGLHNG